MPKDTPTCRIVVPPGQACGKVARKLVVFGDGDKIPACVTCVRHMEETAKAHGTVVAVEDLT